MPRQQVRSPKHSRDRSLGWLAGWWIETFTVHGEGPIMGQPSVLTDEYLGLIVDCYAHDENGRRLYDSAFMSRPKGTDKSGLAARVALFEALGPCRFDGWAEGGETFEYLGQTYVYQAGEPMGKPMQSPVIRVVATEEDQIRRGIYRTIYINLTLETAPLYPLNAYGMDAGMTKIMLPGSGEIIPSTASAASKDGGKETFVVFDETHLYTSKALHEMYDTIVRNTHKRQMEGAWFIETTTMYAPGEDSVAEETFKYAQLIEEGKALRARLLFDHRWGELQDDDGKPIEFAPTQDVEGQKLLEKALRRALTDSYGSALEWVSIESLIDAALDPRSSVVSTMRYFLNAIYDVKEQWIPNAIVDAAMRLGTETKPLRDGDEVTMGFDGSVNNDATVLILCRVSDGAIFPWHVQEQPDTAEAKTWEVDRLAVDAAVAEAFKRFTVVGMFADPPFYRDYLDKWLVEHGDNLRVAAGSHAIEFWTKNQEQMHKALERFRDALMEGVVAFGEIDGRVRAATLSRHVRNARVRERGDRYILGKESAGSVKKIDAAMGAVLAYECRAKYLWKGDKPEPVKPRMAFRVR